MKIKPISFLFIICFLIVIIGRQNLKANNAMFVQNNDHKFSGSELKEENIISKSDVIFVGQVEKIGLPLAKAPGQSTYAGVQVKVLQILKGVIDAHVSVIVHTKHGNTEEVPPITGNSYLFFVKREKVWIDAIKLIPVTDEKITSIKALIASQK